MTTMAGEWTRQDSADLDNYALLHYITPLRRDPVLWELFAQDRAEAPREKPKPLKAGLRGNPVPSHCRECHKPLRSRRVPKDQAPPGAVGHYGRGYCDACYHQKVRKA